MGRCVKAKGTEQGKGRGRCPTSPSIQGGGEGQLVTGVLGAEESEYIVGYVYACRMVT